ncbi:MAG: helix-hairpin-helix domain-containing protein [Acidobacteria bacterium]|nr:helix-hairpin-helix domain-containing protein [Acidobacteriota bacterium]
MRFLVLCIFGASLFAAGNGKQLPEGPGRATTQRLCGSCHGFGNFVRRRETRDGWNSVIEDMIRRGAKGEEEEWAEVSDYLVAQFSPVRVNVNQADASAIAEALRLKPEQAAAIVKHRTDHGGFKSFEELQKVPGVDTALLESRRAQIDF